MGRCRNNGGNRSGGGTPVSPTAGFAPFATLPTAANGGFNPGSFDNAWCGYIAYRVRIQYDGPFFAGADCGLLDNGAVIGDGGIIIDDGGLIIGGNGGIVEEEKKCCPCACKCGCPCPRPCPPPCGYPCPPQHGYPCPCPPPCGYGYYW